MDETDRQRIKLNFHDLIRRRTREFGAVLPEIMPAFDSEAVAELRERRLYLAIDGMYGGFTYWVEGSDEAPELMTSSWSRVVGFSGESHRITAAGIDLVESGFC